MAQDHRPEKEYVEKSFHFFKDSSVDLNVRVVADISSFAIYLAC
jgi:hypothetical protein